MVKVVVKQVIKVFYGLETNLFKFWIPKKKMILFFILWINYLIIPLLSFVE